MFQCTSSSRRESRVAQQQQFMHERRCDNAPRAHENTSTCRHRLPVHRLAQASFSGEQAAKACVQLRLHAQRVDNDATRLLRRPDDLSAARHRLVTQHLSQGVLPLFVAHRSVLLQHVRRAGVEPAHRLLQRRPCLRIQGGGSSKVA